MSSKELVVNCTSSQYMFATILTVSASVVSMFVSLRSCGDTAGWVSYPYSVALGLCPLLRRVIHVASISITAMKRSGLNTSPWGTPRSSVHGHEVPSRVITSLSEFWFMLLRSALSFFGKFSLSIAMSLAQDSSRPKACFRSMNV